MSELAPVLDQLLTEAAAHRPAALCVVVATKGSAPQRPGAAMLLKADASTVGTLGGGCVEQEVKRRAHRALATGQSQLMDFVLDHDYGWDDGLICGGRMEIAALPILNPDLLASIAHAQTAARELGHAAFEFAVHDEAVGDLKRFRLNLEPPPLLLIAGAGHVGTALAGLASELDFQIKVIDDRADYADPARFPAGVECLARDIPATLAHWPIDAGTYVVIVTRGHQHDHQALAAVIHSNATYLGLIGSRRKLRMIFDDLKTTGVTDAQLARVHSPIGLDIGALTVPEIAVSIAAELIQHRRKNKFLAIEGPL